MTALLPTAERWICFSAAGQDYAVDIRAVREVMRSAVVEPVPGAPTEVLGVINLRGQIVTVLDFGGWLGRDVNPEVRPLLVLDHQGVVLALAVDAVHDVLRLAVADIQPVPRAGGGGSSGVLQGLIARESGLMTLLDADALLRQFKN
jgi:purine-binding chemotaxis protein CheW